MEQKRLRIILNTNAPWATSGYAVQAALITERINKEGYPLACINFYGQEGGKLRINDIIMYPKIASPWGDDALVYHGKDFNADISMTLQDIWTMNPNHLKNMRRFIPIVPIDHDPPPVGIVDRLRLAYRIITYSEFGRRELEKLGFYSTYIPHAVDTNVFKPMGNKEILRKQLNVNPELFIFGMVAANKDNPSRKSFQEAIDAFFMFHKKYPNSGMFFHTLLEQSGGFPIEAYWKFLGLPKEKFFYLQPYDAMFRVGRLELAKIINCFDCLVMPSTNEGFGVPAIEAQSCGIPAIVNDFTAMTELIIPGKTGFHCKVGYKRFSPLQSYIGIPDVKSIYECMVKIYEADRKKMEKECVKHIKENYCIEKVYSEKWSPFLTQVEKEIYDTKVKQEVVTKKEVEMPANIENQGGQAPTVVSKT